MEESDKILEDTISGNKWGPQCHQHPTRMLVTIGGSAFYNTIEFVTIASNGNPTDFADTSSQNYRTQSLSNQQKE